MGHMGSTETAIEDNKIDKLKRKKNPFLLTNPAFTKRFSSVLLSPGGEAITEPDNPSQEPWLELELITNY